MDKLKCNGHGQDKYKCKNLMQVTLYANDQIAPGTRLFSRNNGKDFVVSTTTVAVNVVKSKYMCLWYLRIGSLGGHRQLLYSATRLCRWMADVRDPGFKFQADKFEAGFLSE